jgi:hypothetical protein
MIRLAQSASGSLPVEILTPGFLISEKWVTAPLSELYISDIPKLPRPRARSTVNFCSGETK